jgi:hypothetical protein
VSTLDPNISMLGLAAIVEVAYEQLIGNGIPEIAMVKPKERTRSTPRGRVMMGTNGFRFLAPEHPKQCIWLQPTA